MRQAVSRLGFWNLPVANDERSEICAFIRVDAIGGADFHRHSCSEKCANEPLASSIGVPINALPERTGHLPKGIGQVIFAALPFLNMRWRQEVRSFPSLANAFPNMRSAPYLDVPKYARR